MYKIIKKLLINKEIRISMNNNSWQTWDQLSFNYEQTWSFPLWFFRLKDCVFFLNNFSDDGHLWSVLEGIFWH